MTKELISEAKQAAAQAGILNNEFSNLLLSLYESLQLEDDKEAINNLFYQNEVARNLFLSKQTHKAIPYYTETPYVNTIWHCIEATLTLKHSTFFQFCKQYQVFKSKLQWQKKN